MDRTQFTFYESFYKAVSRIKDPVAKAQTYDAICAYALYGTEPDMDALNDFAAISFELIKPNLDASRRKAENGKAGGKSKRTESKQKAKPKQNRSKKENEIESKKENEIENEVEIELESEKESLDTAAHAAPHYDYEPFKTIFNATCTKLPKCRSLTEQRKKAIRAYLKEYTVDQWQDICTNANASDFLTGKNDRGWKADIDFLLRIDKATKALEGGYANKDYRDKYKEDVPEQSSTEEYGFEFGY